MANLRKDLEKIIDAIENLPHHYEEYLAMGSIFVNPFLSKSIFIISYLDLRPRM